MRGVEKKYGQWIELDVQQPIWNSFFTVAPLVVIGTKESDHYDLAPKHMVTALGQENYFGFVCTPSHATYSNVKESGVFTVSFIRPGQVVLASLSAMPRKGESSLEKQIVKQLPTVKAQKVDGILMKDAYLWFECILDRIVDGFGKYSLIAGKVIAAYVHEDDLRFSERDECEMIRKRPLVAYLAYGRFAEIRETFPFPFPRNFDRTLVDS